MKITITKSARKFGYIIWSQRTNKKMKELLGEKTSISVVLNGFSLGEKAIDWKYYRISLGYKFTRALPETASQFHLCCKNGVLEVKTNNEQYGE